MPHRIRVPLRRLLGIYLTVSNHPGSTRCRESPRPNDSPSHVYSYATVRAFCTRSATCTYAVLACLSVTTRVRNVLKRTTCVRLTAPHWRGLVIWPWRTRQRLFSLSLSSSSINTAIHFTSFSIELKSLSVREPSKDDWDLWWDLFTVRENPFNGLNERFPFKGFGEYVVTRVLARWCFLCFFVMFSVREVLS